MSPFNSIDPCTNDIIWQGSPGDVGVAVATARAALPSWASASLDDRIAAARAFQAVVKDRAEAFARLIATETGKPLWETRTEVASVAAKVDISITAQAERTGERSGLAGNVRQTLRHKPHGVLAVLGPYNFPAHLPNGHIVPALLAGNTIVFKPSELTPAVAEFMADCKIILKIHGGGLRIITCTSFNRSIYA
jgi:succinylglutamic semialdehyde dehydrogenase